MVRAGTEEIKNEVEAIKRLHGPDNHQNIVDFFDHGHLEGTSYYFIDMELCDLDLSQYLAGERPLAASEPHVGAVFVPNDCELQLKLQNTFIILNHITSALEFAHKLGLVHRDLKPANGNLFVLRNRN